MKCPECGVQVPSLPCERCRSEKEEQEASWRSLIKEFSLREGPPKSAAGKKSLDAALAKMQRRLDRDGFQGKIKFDPRHLLRSRSWWYVPYAWIGCAGFIIDDEGEEVNWLSSGLNLSDCFWGHERGIVCDVVDFTFTNEIKPHVETVFDLFLRFKRCLDQTDESGNDAVWYDEEEIRPAIESQFPTFRRHFVWFAIPDLRAAVASRSVSFHVTRAQAPTGS